RRLDAWTLTARGGRRSVMESGGDEMALAMKRHRFTVEEYHRMGEAGILTEDDRVELIEGEIVEMTAIGPVHASVVARLINVLVLRLAGRTVVWPQNPLVMARQASEFQPDVALLRPRTDFYSSANPTPRDALLVVEVMDTSVAKDRRGTLRTYPPPAGPAGGDGDAERRVGGRDGSVAPEAFPDLALPVTEILG